MNLPGGRPRQVVRPDDRAELARLLKESDGAVVPFGGGTRLRLGEPIDAASFLGIDLTGLDRIVDHAVDDLTVTVEPGLSLAALGEALRRHGQWIPIDAPFPERATVGGLVATGAWGPLRPWGDTPRRHLIGLEVTGGDGGTHRAGGRVVKNVAGYDLMKIHAGALGSLGIITEMSFRLSPIPEVEIIRSGRLDDPAGAAGLCADLMESGRDPGVCAAFTDGDDARLAVGYLGFREDVDWLETQLVDAAVRRGLELAERYEGVDATRFRESLHWTPGDADVELRSHGLPTTAFERLAALRRLDASRFIAHPTIGAVRALYAPPAVPGASAIRSLRERIGEGNGHLIIETCPDEASGNVDAWGPVEDSSFSIMRGIKAALDPGRRLNPGRVAGRL